MTNPYKISSIEITSGKNPVTESLVGGRFGPHFPTMSTERSLQVIKTFCKVPSEVEFALPSAAETPESIRDGYICMFEVYFTGCGLFFPLPEVLLVFLHRLGLSFSQMSPNMLRIILALLTVAAEAGYSLSNSDLSEFCSVRGIRRGSGYYTMYPKTDRTLITGLPVKEENWSKSWFLVKINSTIANGLTDMLESTWTTSLASQTRPAASKGFLDFFTLVTGGNTNTSWNSFTLDRIHAAGKLIRGGTLRRLDPAPEPLNTADMSFREKEDYEDKQKIIYNRLKEQIDEVGRSHRQKVNVLSNEIPGKTCIVPNLPTSPTISPGFFLRMNF